MRRLTGSKLAVAPNHVPNLLPLHLSFPSIQSTSYLFVSFLQWGSTFDRQIDGASVTTLKLLPWASFSTGRQILEHHSLTLVTLARDVERVGIASFVIRHGILTV